MMKAKTQRIGYRVTMYLDESRRVISCMVAEELMDPRQNLDMADFACVPSRDIKDDLNETVQLVFAYFDGKL